MSALGKARDALMTCPRTGRRLPVLHVAGMTAACALFLLALPATMAGILIMIGGDL